MFNGAPQSAATLIPQLIHLGVSVFRLEGLFEDAQTLRRKVEAYAALLRGEITPEALIASLGTEEKFGVTNGQLYNIRGYRDRKKEFTALAQLPQTADPGLQLIRDGAAPAV
jgi:putative protease